MSTKISKPEIRKTFPTAVAKHVCDFLMQHHIRNASFEVVPPASGVYLDEDARYTVYYRGEWQSFRMLGEWNMVQPTSAMQQAIGQRMPIPDGAWVVETSIFLGKWFCHVYTSGQVALPEAN